MSDSKPAATASVAELQAQIEATRARLAGTIDQLTTKAAPSALLASRPPSEAPMAMPTKPMDPIQDSVSACSCHCLARAAITNEISPTSIASSAQPTPEPTSSRP